MVPSEIEEKARFFDILYLCGDVINVLNEQFIEETPDLGISVRQERELTCWILPILNFLGSEKHLKGVLLTS